MGNSFSCLRSREERYQYRANDELYHHDSTPTVQTNATIPPPQPVDTILSIEDLNDILQILKCNKFTPIRWNDLGLALGLLQPTLDIIEANNERDVSGCLKKCLTKWLKRADNVDSVGPPTWDTLANGLYKINEKAVAQKLAEIGKVCQILQKYKQHISEIAFPVNMMCDEKVIPMETRNSEINNAFIMNKLCSAVYKNHYKLKKFGLILQKSEHTVQLGTDIINDYDHTFLLSDSSSNTAGHVQEIILEHKFQVEFDHINDSLGIMIFKVAPLIKAAIPSLEDLILFIRLTRHQLRPHLSLDKSFNDVIEIIRDSCSITNIVLLENIVSHFSVTEAHKFISTYKDGVTKFCDKEICGIKLKEIPPLICDTIRFIVDWEVDRCTLNNIKGLLQRAFGDHVNKVEIVEANKGHSILIICCAPHDLMDMLYKEAQENIEELKKMGLIQLTIGYYTLYSKHEEMSSDDMKVDYIEEIPDTVPQLEGKVEKSHEDEMMSTDHSKDVPTSGDVLTVSKEKIEALQHKITTQSLTLHEKEKALTQLKEKINAMTKKLKDYETLNQELSNQLKNTEKVKMGMSMELEKLHQELEEKQKEIEILVTSQNLSLLKKEDNKSQLREKLKDYEILNQERSNKLKDTEKAMSMELEKLHQELKQVEKEHETEKESEKKVECQDKLLMKTFENKDERAISKPLSVISTVPTLEPSTQYSTACLKYSSNGSYYLDQRPSVAELTKHVNVSTKWRQVGIQLELDTQRLDAIEANYHGDTDTKLSKMYEEWLNSTPNATRRQLLEVLRRSSINELYIAYKYERFCSQLSEEQQSIHQIEVHVVESRQIAMVDTVHQSHEIVPTHSTILPKYVTDLLEKYSVPEKCLNMKFTDDLLILLTLQIQNMEEIAPHFGMFENDIQQIKEETPEDDGRVVSMLSKWRERKGEGATCRLLVTVLCGSGHWDIIELIISSIRNKYIPSSVAVTVPFDPITYTSWNRLSGSDREVVCNRLRKENILVKEHFAQIFKSIQSSFRGVDHVEVLNYLAVQSDTNHIDWVNKAKEINNIFGVFNVMLQEGCNWLNYHLLDVLVQAYGSMENKGKMADYIQEVLWPYLQRSLYEIPPESVGHQSIPDNVYNFMLPVKESESYSYITGQQMKQIQLLVAKKLQVSVECVHIEFTTC